MRCYRGRFAPPCCMSTVLVPLSACHDSTSNARRECCTLCNQPEAHLFSLLVLLRRLSRCKPLLLQKTPVLQWNWRWPAMQNLIKKTVITSNTPRLKISARRPSPLSTMRVRKKDKGTKRGRRGARVCSYMCQSVKSVQIEGQSEKVTGAALL